MVDCWAAAPKGMVLAVIRPTRFTHLDMAFPQPRARWHLWMPAHERWSSILLMVFTAAGCGLKRGPRAGQVSSC